MNYKFYLFLLFTISLIGCETQKEIEDKIIFSSIFQEAQSNYGNGNYKESLDQYSTILSDYPNQPWLYLRRGDVNSKLGDYDNAIQDYQIVIDANDKNIGQALLKKGLVHFKIAEYSKAKGIFEQLTSLNSDNFSNEIWSSYYHIGQIEFKNGNYNKAIENYEQASIYSETEITNYHMANAHYAIQNFDVANKLYNQSIQFVKRKYILEYPNSHLAQCDTCGFPFGTKEYEDLTIPAKDGHIKILKEVYENEILKDVISNPEKYLDTTFIKENKDLYLIK